MSASATGSTRQKTGIAIVIGAYMAMLPSMRLIRATSLGQLQMLIACSHPLCSAS